MQCQLNDGFLYDKSPHWKGKVNQLTGFYMTAALAYNLSNVSRILSINYSLIKETFISKDSKKIKSSMKKFKFTIFSRWLRIVDFLFLRMHWVWDFKWDVKSSLISINISTIFSSVIFSVVVSWKEKSENGSFKLTVGY